jgi:purine-nucleoside/S-methyl-5'-thioadenosine phosphorylase / adenosine deaminase
MTGKTRVLSTVSTEDITKNSNIEAGLPEAAAFDPAPYNASVAATGWTEEDAAGGWIFRPSEIAEGLVVGFSGRGAAPPGEPSPTAFLARRFANRLRVASFPIVRATQVHGAEAFTVRERPAPGEVVDAGERDILATDLPGVCLVVQTADCVAIVLAGARSVAVVHAGWRGSAKNAAAAGVAALVELGERASSVRAFLGPSIGACCYEVGPEVAARFAGDFAKRSRDGRFLLDLAAVNRVQLGEAGIRPENVSAHPACTRCGGERFASFRRDGAAAGRMIALAARLPDGDMSDRTYPPDG